MLWLLLSMCNQQSISQAFQVAAKAGSCTCQPTEGPWSVTGDERCWRQGVNPSHSLLAQSHCGLLALPCAAAASNAASNITVAKASLPAVEGTGMTGTFTTHLQGCRHDHYYGLIVIQTQGNLDWEVVRSPMHP